MRLPARRRPLGNVTMLNMIGSMWCKGLRKSIGAGVAVRESPGANATCPSASSRAAVKALSETSRIFAKRVGRSSRHLAEDDPNRVLSFVAELEQKAALAAERPASFRERSDIAPGLRVVVHGRYLIFFRELAEEVPSCGSCTAPATFPGCLSHDCGASLNVRAVTRRRLTGHRRRVSASRSPSSSRSW